jgi:hypothetical protein
MAQVPWATIDGSVCSEAKPTRGKRGTPVEPERCAEPNEPDLAQNQTNRSPAETNEPRKGHVIVIWCPGAYVADLRGALLLARCRPC